MKQALFALLLIASGDAVLFPSVGRAEPAYQWTDASGRLFFGSTPPAGAKNVVPVKGGALSRYSSKQMIESFGGYRAGSKPPAAGGKQVKEETLPLNNPARLQSRDLKISWTPKHQVGSLSVAVQNTGDADAADVAVSFLFADGTLVPAAGPSVIAPHGENRYDIPPNQLPITLHEQPGAALDAKPEVIVSLGGVEIPPDSVPAAE